MQVGNIDALQSQISIVGWENIDPRPITHENGMATMRKSCEALKDSGYNYWISSGNLLGIYRDGSLIPHDTDIDINMDLEWGTPTDVFVERLDEILVPKGFKLLRTMKYQTSLMQIVYQDTNDVYLDIYLFYHGILDGHVVNFNELGVIQKPVKFINPVSFLKYENYDYPVPSYLDEFLVWRFGDNWKIPSGQKSSWGDTANHIIYWRA